MTDSQEHSPSVESGDELKRSDLARIALAAWANVRPDQLPDDLAWINHPNDLNRQAWDRVAAAIAEALSLQAPVVAGWREIESAPKDGTMVDLWAAERDRYVNERITGCRYSTRDACWTHPRTIYDDETEDDLAEVFNATHWMPLPLPPLLVGGEEAKPDTPNPGLEAVNGRLA